MTNVNDNRDQASLEQRLNALRDELRESVQKARSRRTTMTVVTLLGVIVVVCYMTFIYHHLAKIDAQFVAEVAYAKVQPYIDESPKMMGKQLRDYAPRAFDYAEQEALLAPAMGAGYVRDTLMVKTTAILDEAEPQITKAVGDAIDQIKTSSQAAGFDPKDQAQVDKLVDKLVQQISTEAQKAIDKVYADYTREGDDILHNLDTLAEGKNLDALQEHHRDIMISFLTLAEKWKTSPPELGLAAGVPDSEPDASVSTRADRVAQPLKGRPVSGAGVLPAAKASPTAPVSPVPPPGAAKPAAPVLACTMIRRRGGAAFPPAPRPTEPSHLVDPLAVDEIMNPLRIGGLVMLATGVVLFIIGMTGSYSVAKQWSNFFTGHFNDATVWYMLVGTAFVMLGVFMVVFKGKPTMAD